MRGTAWAELLEEPPLSPEGAWDSSAPTLKPLRTGSGPAQPGSCWPLPLPRTHGRAVLSPAPDPCSPKPRLASATCFSSTQAAPAGFQCSHQDPGELPAPEMASCQFRDIRGGSGAGAQSCVCRRAPGRVGDREGERRREKAMDRKATGGRSPERLVRGRERVPRAQSQKGPPADTPRPGWPPEGAGGCTHGGWLSRWGLDGRSVQGVGPHRAPEGKLRLGEAGELV